MLGYYLCMSGLTDLLLYLSPRNEDACLKNYLNPWLRVIFYKYLWLQLELKGSETVDVKFFFKFIYLA